MILERWGGCKIQGRTEKCMDAYTQAKSNNRLTILDKILRIQRSTEDKTRIGYIKESDDVCNKVGLVSKQNDTYHSRYDYLQD